MTLTIKLKNGTSITLPGNNQKVRCDGGWIVVTDRTGRETSFPAVSVVEIITKPTGV